MLDKQLRRLIAGAVAEVDPAQIAISQQLTPMQRFQQGYSMTKLAEQVTSYRRHQRQMAQDPLVCSHSQTGSRKQDRPQKEKLYRITARESNGFIRERDTLDMAEPSMDFGDFMRLVLDALEATKIEYLIGGAVAVWAWGEARTTRDFDLVINLPFESIVTLSQELEKRDMLVPVEIIRNLLTKAEGDLPINAIHLYTGYKAELFLLRTNDVYRKTALARRRLVDLGPPLGEVYVHAPEDLILNKLRYFNLSQQPKHTRDIAGIRLTVGDELDTTYLENWAAHLEVLELWQEIAQEI